MRARTLSPAPAFLLALGFALSPGAAPATEPDLEAEDLAEAGAGLEEILEAWSPWRPEAANLQVRWTPTGASWRLAAAAPGVELQGRRAATGGLRGAAVVRRGAWSAALGGWRAVSATGWLSVGGASTRSLTAAGPPLAAGASAGADASSWRTRPVQGLLLQRSGERWRVLAGAGDDGAADRADSAPRLIALGGGIGSFRSDVFLLARRGERAGAWSAELGGRDGGLWWEAARLDGAGLRTALQGGAHWRPAAGWGLDVAASSAAVGFRPLEGGRSPLIPGAAGRGWALRLRRGWTGGWRMAVLLHGGVAERPERGPDELDRRALAEMRLEGEASATTRLRLRARLRTARRDGWEGREVWETPAPSRPERELTLAVGAESRSGAAVWRADLRGRLRDDETGLRRRSLLELLREGPAPGGGRWRLRSAVAWGDELDLVSVAVPAPGAPTLKHWGRRDDETSLGWRGGWGPGVWTAAAWWSGRAASGSPEVGFLLIFQATTATSGRAAGF